MKLDVRTFASLLGFAASVHAISKVTRTGRYLYTDDGNRFFIKGIAYQTQGQIIPGPDNPLNQPSTFVDNLADANACSRDIPNLQTLGANAIRAYSVDSTLNHDSCMNALSNAGIYVIIDLTLPLNGSIDTTQPTWGTNLLDQYIKTINAFNKYDNVLAYNVGNEVLTFNATNAAPFLKAAARDIKAYLASIKSSALVGYADIDGAASFRDAVANFLSCDPTSSNSGATAIDIFGLNNYEWCGNASTSTYDSLNSEFENYNVAAYFSEFGSENCNPGTRVWTEVGTLFSSPMTDIWSGGLAFSYFSAESQGHDFGMITLSSDNSTATPNADFNNLVNEYKQVQFVNSPAQASAPAATFPSCPTEGASLEASTALPSTPNESACDCVQSSLPCLFKPPSPDYNVVLGTLTGVVCGLLPGAGGNCNDIAANGTTGVYGVVSGCDPTIKLSYAFSQYFQLTSRAATSCDFSGNATLVQANAAVTPSAAAASCIASPSAVFTPSASPPAASGSSSGGSSGSGGGSSSGGSSGSGQGSGALSFERGPLVGMAVAAAGLVWGAMWTLS